jgi:hypothetical protein
MKSTTTNAIELLFDPSLMFLTPFWKLLLKSQRKCSGCLQKTKQLQER